MMSRRARSTTRSFLHVAQLDQRTTDLYTRLRRDHEQREWLHSRRSAAVCFSNMPVESTAPEIKVTRPEIYFGEKTDRYVYVKTKQNEFDYPQGDTNTFTTYQGTGGIRVGNRLRRMLLAWSIGDLQSCRSQTTSPAIAMYSLIETFVTS